MYLIRNKNLRIQLNNVILRLFLIEYAKKMTQIKKITIKGFRNIGEVSINLQNITTLLAPNNYGKSNVLSALTFGFRFMKELPETRQKMMNDISHVSINKNNAGLPFNFEIEGMLSENEDFVYGYGFEWKRSRNMSSTDGTIVSEYLKIRKNIGEHSQYNSFILRNRPEKAQYKPSLTGRCSKTLFLNSCLLAIDKLSNYDDLFFNAQLKAIMRIEVLGIDTLSDPKEHYSLGITVKEGKIVLSEWLGKYLFELKTERADDYAYLMSIIGNLVPSIESIEPVIVNVKGKNVDDDVPFELPDQYDIMVKEEFNNQSTRFQYLSTGCMKILYLLVNIFKASHDHVQLLLAEELENSIHPKLLQSLLVSVEALLGETKLLFTSHSPYLSQYLSAPQIFVGLPSENGLVDFRILKTSKVKTALKIASAGNMSLGEYLFELMLDMESDPELMTDFFGEKKGGMDA